MDTFMERMPKGEKMQFMKREPEKEKLQFMKRDRNDWGNNEILNNNIKNERSVYSENNTASSIQNSGEKSLIGPSQIQYTQLMSKERIKVNDIICYENDIYGIRLLSDKGTIQLTNFIIEAEKKQIKDDGIRKEVSYVLQCKLVGQIRTLKRIELKSKELITPDWIKSKLGIEYNIYDNQLYKYLEIYIGKLFVNVNSEIIYEHVGWRRIGDKRIYIHGGGIIGEYNSNIKGRSDKTLEIDYSLNKIDALNQTLNMIKIADPIKTVPMFLYTHLSVLKEIFKEGGANPEFSLWLEGLTGSRKTSVAKVFFNVFNRSNDYIPATFKDTVGSIEEKSFQYKDSPLILDDFFHSISKNEWNYTQQTASEMLRRFGDGFSKSRLDKNMERAKEYPPRGMLVITGELTIKGESSVSRYLTIGIEKNDINLEVLKHHQENNRIFSTHLYHFIQWVSNNSNRIIQYIKDNFRNLRNENQGKYRHGRLIETYTIYQLICNIFWDYCLELGIMDKVNRQYLVNNWCQFISEAILIHEKANLQENPAVMYLQALQQLICDGEIKLRLKEKNGDKSIVGYEDDEYYYLSSEVMLREIIKYWKRFSIEFTATSEMVTKALDVLGAIKTAYEGGKIRRTLKISGDSRRFLIINKSKMEDIVNDVG